MEFRRHFIASRTKSLPAVAARTAPPAAGWLHRSHDPVGRNFGPADSSRTEPHAMVGSIGRVGAAGDDADTASSFSLIQKIDWARSWITREGRG